MDTEKLIRILEGTLLAAGKPLNIQQIAELFEEAERPSNEEIRAALELLTARCEGRGFELRQVASGYRFQVVEEISPWVGRLWEEKPQRYSRALLETLALIAYRQPITRGDIEDIRGVAVSSQIVKTLLEREWVRVVGHKDVPGRPAMYATTRKFLDYFNLRNLDDLPALADIKDLDNLSGELGFGDEVANGEKADDAGEAVLGAEDRESSEGPAADLVSDLESASTEQPPESAEPEEEYFPDDEAETEFDTLEDEPENRSSAAVDDDPVNAEPELHDSEKAQDPESESGIEHTESEFEPRP